MMYERDLDLLLIDGYVECPDCKGTMLATCWPAELAIDDQTQPEIECLACGSTFTASTVRFIPKEGTSGL